MKIFLTGSTGFIGGHLVKRLARTEHKLCCLVRKTSQVSELEKLGANLITGDITDRNSLLRGMNGCEWLVHLASRYELWVPNRRVYKEVNIDGVRNVMEAAVETGIRKVVLVSTAAVYGNAQWPITEKSQLGVKCLEFSRYIRRLTAVCHAERALGLRADDAIHRQSLSLLKGADGTARLGSHNAIHR